MVSVASFESHVGSSIGNARAVPVVYGASLASTARFQYFGQHVALMTLWLVSFGTRLLMVLFGVFAIGYTVVYDIEWRVTGAFSFALVFVWKLFAEVVGPGVVMDATGVVVFCVMVLTTLGLPGFGFLMRAAVGLGVIQVVWIMFWTCSFQSVFGLGFLTSGPIQQHHSQVIASAYAGATAQSAIGKAQQLRAGSAALFGVVPGKRKCDGCGFWVNPVGHAGRCRPPPDHKYSDAVRQAAWLGDVLHLMDVRRMLLAARGPVTELQVRASTLVDRKAQADYYNNYSGRKVSVPGTSLHSLSQAFEASYVGEFRSRYLAEVLHVFDTLQDGGLEQEIELARADLRFVV